MKTPSNLSGEQQLFFLKRLDRLLEHGYSFIDALEMMELDTTLQASAQTISETLKVGKHIDHAFETANFHTTIISYLYFVRFNGNIQASIQKCITMFEHRMKHIKKFKQVIRYPIVLFTLFFLLLIFIKTSVLPSFIDIFQTSSESSKTIFISITMIDIVSTVCIVFLIVLIISSLLWLFYKRQFPIEKQLAIYEKIPVYRTILRLQTSYYMATHINMFLKTGMSIKDIIIQMKEQQKLLIIAYYAELMYLELQNGHYMDHLLQQLPFIDKHLALLFEKNNNVYGLEKDLEIYAYFLTETMEQKIMKMITFIQPLVFTFLAVMIIFIYLTLMWPMFQLIKTV